MVKIRKLSLAAVLLILLVIIFFNPLHYFLGFTVDQISLLSKSESIDETILNPRIPEQIKLQLQRVPRAMEFGDKAGFPKTNAYQNYIQLDRDVFLHSLSATHKDHFEDYYWTWPFVGKLPYKGFAQKREAVWEQEQLRMQGYDTYLGESIALSTLGIFSDPILSTMIDANDSTALLNTLYHERTHQLFFRKNDVAFNENAAVLLGSLAALEFLKKEAGVDSEEYNLQMQKIKDQLLFSEFIDEFYDELNQLYLSNLSSEEKIGKREEIFTKHLQKYRDIKPKFHNNFKKFGEGEMNNAYILSYYRYYGRIHVYHKVHEGLGWDLHKTIQFFNEIAYGEEEPEVQIKKFIRAS